MIAFLGGLVGVISLTRVNKGNPIPELQLLLHLCLRYVQLVMALLLVI